MNITWTLDNTRTLNYQQQQYGMCGAAGTLSYIMPCASQAGAGKSEGERSSKLGNLLQPPKLFSQSLELFANNVGIWCSTQTRLK